MSSAAVNRVEVTVKISNAVATDVTEATVKQVLGISAGGNPAKYLNEQGNFTTPAGGGGSVNWGSIGGTLSSQTDLQTALNGKQNTLGFTPENVANKSTSVTTDQASNTKYPSVKAVYDWVLSLGYITSAALAGYATQAYVNAQGFITNVVTALGYTPANKAGDTFTGSISASNLSGTNTGDETASGIRTKVGNASASNTGVLSSTDWSTFNGKQDALGFTAVPNTRTISTSLPLSGGGDLSANRTLAIADAAADGATKGAAAFTAADFNSAAGVISIDYANGQSASAANKGFLTAADWSTFNGKQSALSGTGFVRQDGAATTYDTLSRLRTFSQTCAEVSLTGTTTETIVDTITIAANTLAANDIMQVYARFLKTSTAAATVRIYTNTTNSLSGATLLGSFIMSAANRFLGFERHIICKASGLIEVASATNTTNASDENVISAAETTTTITYSNINYLIISMQLSNSADTIRRSFSQVQHQRQAS